MAELNVQLPKQTPPAYEPPLQPASDAQVQRAIVLENKVVALRYKRLRAFADGKLPPVTSDAVLPLLRKYLQRYFGDAFDGRPTFAGKLPPALVQSIGAAQVEAVDTGLQAFAAWLLAQLTDPATLPQLSRRFAEFRPMLVQMVPTFSAHLRQIADSIDARSLMKGYGYSINAAQIEMLEPLISTRRQALANALIHVTELICSARDLDVVTFAGAAVLDQRDAEELNAKCRTELAQTGGK